MRRRTVLGGAIGGALAGAVAAPPVLARPDRVAARPKVRTGLEVLARDGYRELAGQKVGVVTNPTGIFADLRHEVDVLNADPRVEVTAVFGPEHGFRGTAQANGSEGSYRDPKTGLPVYDTFNASGEKLAGLIADSGVDTLVFDIQDVGARFYTYVWTMFDTMEAAASLGRRVVVLDRPNPIGGEVCDGPVLRPEYATFVGRRPISLRHGMTAGELARLFAAEFLDDAVDLSVVGMEGWKRSMRWADTGLPWVLPSPNMPTPGTAEVYPAMCLFSGTNLSQGRGTTRPFQIVGAPFIDHRWAEALTAMDLPGVMFRDAYFEPTFSTYAGQACGGIEVFATDSDALDTSKLGVAVLMTVRRLYPGFAWRNEGTAEQPRYWIDNLTGSDLVRTGIEAGHSVDRIVASWQPELEAFRRLRRRYLRYR